MVRSESNKWARLLFKLLSNNSRNIVSSNFFIKNMKEWLSARIASISLFESTSGLCVCYQSMCVWVSAILLYSVTKIVILHIIWLPWRVYGLQNDAFNAILASKALYDIIFMTLCQMQIIYEFSQKYGLNDLDLRASNTSKNTIKSVKCYPNFNSL